MTPQPDGAPGQKHSDPVTAVLSAALSVLVTWALLGWLLMVLLGMVHSYAPSVPALGYYPAVGGGILLSMVLGVIRRST